MTNIYNTAHRDHFAVDNVITQKGSSENAQIISSAITSKLSNKKLIENSEYHDSEFGELRTYKSNHETEFNFLFDPILYPKRDISYFVISQKWVGNIIELTNNGFKAKLIDKTSGGTYEIGEFEKNDVSRDDLPLIRIGATFYLSVGYENNSSGQIAKSLVLRFQRLAEWTEQDFDSAKDAADNINKKIIWE
jgi:hypothetical protein